MTHDGRIAVQLSAPERSGRDDDQQQCAGEEQA
jgi:hypothetical protein